LSTSTVTRDPHIILVKPPNG